VDPNDRSSRSTRPRSSRLKVFRPRHASRGKWISNWVSYSVRNGSRTAVASTFAGRLLPPNPDQKRCISQFGRCVPIGDPSNGSIAGVGKGRSHHHASQQNHHRQSQSLGEEFQRNLRSSNRRVTTNAPAARTRRLDQDLDPHAARFPVSSHDPHSPNVVPTWLLARLRFAAAPTKLSVRYESVPTSPRNPPPNALS
jgi:hypothetical protein